ncbi:MAG: hypothetical protein ACLFSL_03970 [Candidatus Woesearchaeota archaeon]
MFKKIAVAGFGAFGFAMTEHLSKQFETKSSHDSQICVYDDDAALMSHLHKKRTHKYLFKDIRLRENVDVASSMSDLLEGADILLVCIPVRKIRNYLESAIEYMPDDIIILNCSKGIEYETGKLVSDIFLEMMASKRYRYAFLSGGMIASEFIRDEGIFSADIVSRHARLRGELKRLFENDKLFITAKSGLRSSEILSALKNVVSIGVGILEGLDYPYSTRALFISSSMYEIRSFSVMLSGEGKKDPGLSFFGDFITSTTGDTRNKYLGKLIGRGTEPQDAIRQLHKKNLTAEGFWTINAISDVLAEDKSRFPILSLLHDILYRSRDARDISSFMVKERK